MNITQTIDQPLQRFIVYAVVLLGTVVVTLAPEVVYAAIDENDIIQGTINEYETRMKGIVAGVGGLVKANILLTGHARIYVGYD